MRMKFVAPLITLLSFVTVNALENVNHWGDEGFCKCGPKFHSVVSLMDARLKRSFCGGSIINKKQVLTLAQCVSTRNLGDFKVVVKLFDGNPESVYNVESVVFRTESFNASRDIAIVNIVQPFNDKAIEGKVCLPFSWPNDLFTGYGFRIMGWHRHSDKTTSSVSSELVSLNNVGLCVNDDDYLRNKCLCINRIREDYDDYDGGEPVYWEMEDERQVLIGMVLTRFTCEGDKMTAVLRIGQFTKWIQSHAPEDFFYCKVR